jgi:hypothetical protein
MVGRIIYFTFLFGFLFPFITGFVVGMVARRIYRHARRSPNPVTPIKINRMPPSATVSESVPGAQQEEVRPTSVHSVPEYANVTRVKQLAFASTQSLPENRRVAVAANVHEPPPQAVSDASAPNPTHQHIYSNVPGAQLEEVRPTSVHSLPEYANVTRVEQLAFASTHSLPENVAVAAEVHEPPPTRGLLETAL